MKTNHAASVLDLKDFEAGIKRIFQNFNQLSEKKINPLLSGIFLLGLASTLFEPGMVAYLTVIFGASSGIAYAVTKNQTEKNLPTWIFPAIGVASALLYAVAGVPGVILGAGLSGGWYLHGNFLHKCQQWKMDFNAFSEKFKTNPISLSAHLTFKALQFLSDLIISIEPEKPEEPKIGKVEPSNNTKLPTVALCEQNKDEPIIALQNKLEEPVVETQPQTTEEVKPEMPQPTPVLFSQTTPKPSITKVIKPKKDTITVFGKTVLELERKQVEIDSSWSGLAKAFFYSMDPRVDLVNKTNKNNGAGMR